MRFNDLLDMKLKDVLEEYCCIYNLECGYYYGFARYDEVDELYNEYDIESYSEAFGVETLINEELLVSYDEEILSAEKLVKILDNLGIKKKKNE